MLWLRYLLWGLARCVLALRYRLRVYGLDQVQGLKGPVLILPNHPGYIDPALVLAALWPALKPRPMVFETMFRNPLVRPFLKLLNALRVPDLDSQASSQAREEAQTAVKAVIDGLKKGENFVLWPSGRIQRGGVEVLGGARALTDILQAVPEANVVLVRTTGVWGSMFSYARTGKQPELTKMLFAGLGLILANLLFFAPRRRVDVTVEKANRNQLPEPRREKINPWFENWYNSKGQSQPVFVRYHFLLGPRHFEFPKLGGLDEVDLNQIKPETKDAVNHLIADKLRRPLTEQERKPEITLDQLGLDSLDRMEIMLQVEQQFGFSGQQVPANLGQIWALAQGLAETGTPKPPAAAWFQPLGDDSPLEINGDTIAAAFVTRALASRQDVAAVDDLAGAISYERLLVAALLMAKRFAKIQSPNVGLLLPASVGCDIALFGLYLAGKLPVILNWTTGPANLAHAAKLLNLTHVVSSKGFIDRTAIIVQGTEYLYLEEIRENLGKFKPLLTLLTVRLRPGGVRRLIPHIRPDQPAVVLFTSGSEKSPKAVPLTHANLLGNLRSGLSVLGLTRNDSILGFLPMFHSFGISVTGLLPLATGMRVVHHPDPTDAGGLVRKIAAYKPTLLVGTPTFLSYIIDRAKAGDLDSLRLILVGAEKCPEALFGRCAELAPHAALLEGYGITECSPVVSANMPAATRSGTVGRPLPGVELLVLDLDAEKPLEPNQLGMLLVGGPTIFPGYIGYDGPSPFKEIDGKRWYVTGDLATIDDDGFVHFGGRMKRFLKAGGEMISLPALEEPFTRRYPPTKDGPRVAVEGRETVGGRRIVLFSTEALNVHDANAKLMEDGFRGVMRLDEVRQVEKIPVLGTGKTDYKALLALIEK
ncbi:MAG TPA: AMP-binding protein [Pirellulales bacterium]|nr:AMP-binding protein [Pirellulales bacterium]